MGKIYKYFSQGAFIYCCKKCGTDISNRDDLVSKNFRGKTGEAYLFNRVINIRKGLKKDVNFSTGEHEFVVKNQVGTMWFNKGYALRTSEKYKQNKVVLEKLQLQKNIRR